MLTELCTERAPPASAPRQNIAGSPRAEHPEVLRVPPGTFWMLLGQRRSPSSPPAGPSSARVCPLPQERKPFAPSYASGHDTPPGTPSLPEFVTSYHEQKPLEFLPPPRGHPQPHQHQIPTRRRQGSAFQQREHHGRAHSWAGAASHHSSAEGQREHFQHTPEHSLLRFSPLVGPEEHTHTEDTGKFKTLVGLPSDPVAFQAPSNISHL